MLAMIASVATVSCRMLALATPHPIRILREATLPSISERPSPEKVLEALAQAQHYRPVFRGTPILRERHLVFQRYVAPGKQWRLVYVASKDQISAARARSSTLPGLYVNGFVNYAQSFEGEGANIVKTEGITGELFGQPFFIGDIARIKWPQPDRRTTMVIESSANILRAFGREWSFPADGVTTGPLGDRKFQEAPVRKKSSGGPFTIVNIIYADANVAVAQAETGAVALYGAPGGQDS